MTEPTYATRRDLAHYMVSVGRDATSDFFDEAVAEFYRRNRHPKAPMLIDFQAARFIEIATLVNSIALITARTEAGQSTAISLPLDSAVFDFLRVWRFPEAVAAATQRDFQDLIPSAERPWLSRPIRHYIDPIRKSALDWLQYDPDWKPQSSDTRRNFFEFQTVTSSDAQPIGPETFSSLAHRMSRSWNTPLIREVLGKHFGERHADDIARVVIYESVANAVRHPDARRLQVVAKFEDAADDRPGVRRSASRDGKPPHLRICVWDDGTPIANTLRALTDKNRPIRVNPNELPWYMYDEMLVQERTFDGSITDEYEVNEADELPSRATDSRLLLWSLFPGVTRNPEGSVPEIASYLDATRVETRATRGMGLYALRKIALDQYQGDLVIRSGGHRLLLEHVPLTVRKRAGVGYRVKITEYPAEVPPFRGNLLVIGLPVRRTQRSTVP